jgi:hypothetical protein
MAIALLLVQGPTLLQLQEALQEALLEPQEALLPVLEVQVLACS